MSGGAASRRTAHRHFERDPDTPSDSTESVPSDGAPVATRRSPWAFPERRLPYDPFSFRLLKTNVLSFGAPRIAVAEDLVHSPQHYLKAPIRSLFNG